MTNMGTNILRPEAGLSGNHRSLKLYRHRQSAWPERYRFDERSGEIEQLISTFRAEVTWGNLGVCYLAVYKIKGCCKLKLLPSVIGGEFNS